MGNFEMLHDISLDGRVGCGCQSENCSWANEHNFSSNAQERRTEVVGPLREAVRLVHTQQSHDRFATMLSLWLLLLLLLLLAEGADEVTEGRRAQSLW